jgi:DNA polymerase-3 subunit beta
MGSPAGGTGDGFDEVTSTTAGEVVIGFNARYFLDVLGAMDDAEIVLGMGRSRSCGRQARQRATADYKAVVMPMRI